MIDDFHWKCFLFLEKELVDMQYFIEFHEKNKKTFSMQLRSIILQTCSEIEKMFKLICGYNLADDKNIADYTAFFEENHKEFCEIQIYSNTYLEKICPWESWYKALEKFQYPPKFWQAYNDLKHKGKFEQATLDNAILSLAGLYALQLAWIKKEFGRFPISSFESPKLFAYKGTQVTLLSCGHPYLNVPGFSNS